MDGILAWWIAIAVVALIYRDLIGQALRRMNLQFLAKTWKLVCRLLWSAPIWLTLTVFSSALLHEIFPGEPVYIFSGSWIVVVPALVWGVVIGWIMLAGLTGSQSAVEGDTIDRRIDALFAKVGAGLGRVMRYGAWLVAAGVAVGAIVLVSLWANQSIADMSTNEAIIVGAVIVAIAVSSTRRA
ncbi:hypothetical protein ACFOD9_11305 [Novosphingobium bradum]|uniref:Mechanosensitive ion channel protein MscS n=1 Tax=Novosphingobium bradum TaxID=1737444 RepID=A0ABV7IV66_9SPHN